ncbi:hypothetical protein ACOSQ3_031752 [Xanthoceras sorbifolium]
MLIQAREIYTKAIFEEFQEQFVEAVELNIIKCIEDGGDSLYTVTLYDSYGKEDDCRKRYVKRDSTDILSCNCRMFETKGVLCSHIIKVLRDNMNIKEIPAQYILKRWTKQVRSECVQDMHLQQTSPYRSLCFMFTRISSRVSKSENAYNLANEHASNLARLVEDILHLEMNGNKHVKDQNSQGTSIVVECTQNDHLMKAKGLKKKETLKVSLAKKKKKSNPPLQSKVFVFLVNITIMFVFTAASATHLLPMVVIEHYKPAINGPFLLTFYEWHQQNNSGILFGIQNNQAYASATMHSVSGSPFDQSQQTKFQSLLQQNKNGFSFEIQDSQDTNNTNSI